jgi:hypothetical protein
MQTTDKVPNAAWFSRIAVWLEDAGEILLAVTPAGCGGATGYAFCKGLSEVAAALDRHSDAARVIAYKSHSLDIRGTVDERFISTVKARIPPRRDFLLISLEPSPWFGVRGYRGQSHEDLEEYLRDRMGEQVCLGLDPDDEAGEDGISVVYKGGIVGAY